MPEESGWYICETDLYQSFVYLNISVAQPPSPPSPISPISPTPPPPPVKNVFKLITTAPPVRQTVKETPAPVSHNLRGEAPVRGDMSDMSESFDMLVMLDTSDMSDMLDMLDTL